MKAKRMGTWTIALLAIALAAMTVWMRVGSRARPQVHEFVLANGEKVSGLLMLLSESRLVLQTEARSWIVAAGDIRRVDGKPVPNLLPVTGDFVIAQETFEDVLSSGEVDVHSSIRHSNDGQTPIRELRWGMAPHELDYIDSFHMLDTFGNAMPLEVYEERPGGGKGVKVTLVRPLFPGEEAWYTSRFRQTEGAFRDGGDWIYRHVGDYPEHRLVTRSVLLPQEAEVVSISPEPLHREMVQGRLLVVWCRFFMRGEKVPWEIRYRL